MLEPGASTSGLIRPPLTASVGPRPEIAITCPALSATGSALSGSVQKQVLGPGPPQQPCHVSAGLMFFELSDPPTTIELRAQACVEIVLRSPIPSAPRPPGPPELNGPS